QPEHAEDEQVVLPVRLDLRALRHVEHVLQGQRMEMKLLAEARQHLRLPEAVHVDPRYARPPEPLEALLRRLRLVLGQALRGVVHDRDPHRRAPRGRRPASRPASSDSTCWRSWWAAARLSRATKRAPWTRR